MAGRVAEPRLGAHEQGAGANQAVDGAQPDRAVDAVGAGVEDLGVGGEVVLDRPVGRVVERTVDEEIFMCRLRYQAYAVTTRAS